MRGKREEANEGAGTLIASAAGVALCWLQREPASRGAAVRWMRLDDAQKMATIDNMIGELVASSGKIRQYDVHRGPSAAASAERHQMSYDIDDVSRIGQRGHAGHPKGVQELRLELQLACVPRRAASALRWDRGVLGCAAGTDASGRPLPQRPTPREDSSATTARSGPEAKAELGSSTWTRQGFLRLRAVIVEPVVVWKDEARFPGVSATQREALARIRAESSDAHSPGSSSWPKPPAPTRFASALP